jgi:pimeloyl-ACP methyl ester carboxylesterase
MHDEVLKTPLAALDGVPPPAPDWFRDALARMPARETCVVDGARIETLAWGERGRPGLLFLHGNAAHADWWSFIAPFFTDCYRVAAMSWSGMGGSDWRTAYSLDQFVAEAFASARAAGLFESGRPVFVGHSFGGFPVAACAARDGDALRAAVIVDTPFLPPERVKEQREKLVARGMPGVIRIYPTQKEALARFRLLPSQPCENLFLLDFIARHSLKPVDTGVEQGVAWRFDPLLWRHYRMSNPIKHLAAAKCPLGFVRGSRSRVMTRESAEYVRTVAPPGSPFVEIPEAYHHVMLDQPLAFVSALRALLAAWAPDNDAASRMDDIDGAGIPGRSLSAV